MSYGAGLRLGGLLLLALLPHLPLVGAEYVQDDRLAVEQNPVVERGRLGEIFGSSYWAHARGADGSLYRPLTVLSFAWERRLARGAHPAVSHAVNLGLHLGATLALLLLGRRLLPRRAGAWAAAALFAVHPVHTEAVANVVGRAELLAAGSSFAALWLISHAAPGCWPGAVADRPPASRRRLAAWGAALALFCALASKEIALATPVLLLALLVAFRSRDGNRPRIRLWVERLAALAPAALAVELYLILRVHALGALLPPREIPLLDNPLVALEGGERIAAALGLVADYARLLVFPIGLTADYSGNAIELAGSLLAPGPLAGATALGGLAALALAGRRVGAAVAFAAMLILLPYLIVGNLLTPIGTIFAERLLYLPSGGFCLLVGTVAGRAERLGLLERRVALVIAAVVLAAASWLTWSRCLDWSDEERLFRAAVRVNPSSPRAHFVVALAAERDGDLEAALRAVRSSLKLWPEQRRAWLLEGVILGRLGRLRDAESALAEAIRLRPDSAEARYNLALALHRQGRLIEAERSLRHAVLLDPASANVFAELGNVLFEQRRHDEAEAAYRRAVALGRPDVAERLRAVEAARGSGP